MSEQYWLLSLESPTSNDMRFVGKARLVKKAKDYATFEAPFLICGQISFVQARMAFSSRSTALLTGFWQEKPSLFMRCQMLRSSYLTWVHVLTALRVGRRVQKNSRETGAA